MLCLLVELVITLVTIVCGLRWIIHRAPSTLELLVVDEHESIGLPRVVETTCHVLQHRQEIIPESFPLFEFEDPPFESVPDLLRQLIRGEVHVELREVRQDDELLDACIFINNAVERKKAK